jgi:AraC-like DNA-binding protein
MPNLTDQGRREANTPKWGVGADLLSQITDHVRLKSETSGVVRVTPPFATTITQEGFDVILMAHGQLYVTVLDAVDDDPTLVESGDVLIMPRGAPYRLHYPMDAPPTLDSTLEQVEDSRRPHPHEIEFLGVGSHLDQAHRILLVDFLPTVVHIKKGTPGITHWVKRTVDLFRAEHQARLPGRGSILSRLAEIVCVQALRIWIQQLPPDAQGSLWGVHDEHISAALQAIHSDPSRRWTVGSLARHAGMSRTVFATRFKALVGASPMEYVCRWRMSRAIGLLESGTKSVKGVVEAAGYRSEATFRINFKRQFGVLPSRYRRK